MAESNDTATTQEKARLKDNAAMRTRVLNMEAFL
jgi:hypothetical protein